MVAYTHYLSDPRVKREAEALVGRGDVVDFICLRKMNELGYEIINDVNVYRIEQNRYRGNNIFTYYFKRGKP